MMWWCPKCAREFDAHDLPSSFGEAQGPGCPVCATMMDARPATKPSHRPVTLPDSTSDAPTIGGTKAVNESITRTLPLDHAPITELRPTDFESAGQAPAISSKDEDSQPTAPATVEEFCRQAVESGVLSKEELNEARRSLVPDDSSMTTRDFSRTLVEGRYVTQWQRQQLLAGRHQRMRVDRYVLLDHLGDGGMGSVYKARHALMNRLVAVKVVRRQSRNNEVVLERFRREVTASGRLQHPHFVQAHDVAEVGDLIVLILEYVDGPNLLALVRDRGPLPIPIACHFIRQAALALHHAHELGMIHRDVKPSNMLVTERSLSDDPTKWPRLKVSDMGLVRFERPGSLGEHAPSPGAASGMSGRHKPLRTITKTGAVIGTIAFMAPEQSVDSHSADERADIYSLGATLYFLLTGKAPLSMKGSYYENLARLAKETPEKVGTQRPECPEELEAFLQVLLSKDPGDRPDSARDVADFLECFINSTATIGTSPESKASTDIRKQVVGDAATLTKPWYARLKGLMSRDIPSPLEANKDG